MPARREVTIRDCLANTTGLATYRRSPHWLSTKFKKIHRGIRLGHHRKHRCRCPHKSYRERVEAHARIPLSFEPGSDYEYHIGYPVLGVVIETITGQTLEEFFQERIFRPLGMKDTSFYLDKAKLKRFSTSYQPKYENGQWGMAGLRQAETSEKVRGPKVHFGAGGDLGGAFIHRAGLHPFCPDAAEQRANWTACGF